MQCCNTEGLPHCDSHQEQISSLPGPSSAMGDIQLVKLKAMEEEELSDEAERHPMI